jgi:hypothetical protein
MPTGRAARRPRAAHRRQALAREIKDLQTAHQRLDARVKALAASRGLGLSTAGGALDEDAVAALIQAPPRPLPPVRFGRTSLPSPAQIGRTSLSSPAPRPTSQRADTPSIRQVGRTAPPGPHQERDPSAPVAIAAWGGGTRRRLNPSSPVAQAYGKELEEKVLVWVPLKRTDFPVGVPLKTTDALGRVREVLLLHAAGLFRMRAGRAPGLTGDASRGQVARRIVDDVSTKQAADRRQVRPPAPPGRQTRSPNGAHRARR